MNKDFSSEINISSLNYNIDYSMQLNNNELDLEEELQRRFRSGVKFPLSTITEENNKSKTSQIKTNGVAEVLYKLYNIDPFKTGCAAKLRNILFYNFIMIPQDIITLLSPKQVSIKLDIYKAKNSAEVEKLTKDAKEIDKLITERIR